MSQIDILSQVPIFQRLSKETLGKISPMIETVEFIDGATIFSEGSDGDSLYIVISGEITILKSVSGPSAHKKTATAEKSDKEIATLQRGDFFGEMALLDDVPRSASAQAKGDVSVLKISRDNFWQFVKTNAADALQPIILLARTMSDRLRITTIESTIVYELGKIFSAGLLQKELGVRIIEQVETVLPAGSFGALCLWNEFNEEYEWAAVSRSVEFPLALRRNLSRTEPISKYLEENRSPLHSQNWKEDSRFKLEEKNLYGSFEGSLLVIPIFKTENQHLLPSGHWISTCPLLGFFLYGFPGKPSGFDRQLIHLLTTIAHLSATALENAAHREEEIARSKHDQRRQVTF